MTTDLIRFRALLDRRYWIFDLDGTITKPVHDFVAIRKALGVPEATGILEYIASQPEPEKTSLNRKLSSIERNLAEQAEPTPGVLKLLHQLSEQGRVLAILTRNQRECVDISLQRLGVRQLFADAAIIACEDAAPKPDPEGVKKLLNSWQTSPDNCLIVGDFLYDLQAGAESAIATVHYGADRPERWPELTDAVVEDFTVLTRMLSDSPG
ncbi:HAD family hydrolase [Motiliproteus sp. MSK22-1]|uniref:HAD family hydrolase n=1 Tax=Motiliproteus sp. MSK22-1 TaxID=1897630 RepID=UPI0009F98B11|nr:HAD-IA family hydrolase [Motiliproteus sp. MSK22-1]